MSLIQAFNYKEKYIIRLTKIGEERHALDILPEANVHRRSPFNKIIKIIIIINLSQTAGVPNLLRKSRIPDRLKAHIAIING